MSLNQKFKGLWPLLAVLILSLPAIFNLFRPGYFSMHDDIQVMRLYQMEKCFLDGQIPCRWVPDMGAGFGYPLFNFYPVFPYYLGVIFRLFSLSFITIVKILFALSLILSGIFIYFLTKDFFGNLGGLVAAVFYVYAPYHSVDVYVRGALAESWSFVFFPLIFLGIYKFIKNGRLLEFLISVFSLSGLMLSHNIMTLIFVPIAFCWAIFWLVVKKKIKAFTKVLLIFFWAGGLASFYLLPSFLEKSLVKAETLVSDYYNFRNHFVAIRQLFVDQSFGYGPSRLGLEDGMSFQIGWIHWATAIISGAAAILIFLRQKRQEALVLVFSFFVWWFSVFMTHAKSVFIWEKIPLLSFVQFPWRFLGIVMFAGAFLAGGLTKFFSGNKRKSLVIFLILGTVLLNLSFFRPEKFYPEKTDEAILSGENWKAQSMGALLDYLPKKVKEIPSELAPEAPLVTEGKAQITEFRERSDFWRFTIDVSGRSEAKVRVPIFDFPRWEVLIDQKLTTVNSDNPYGNIEINIPPGKHTVVGWFKNTLIREVANGLTLISFSGLVLFIVLKSNEKVI